MIAALVPAHNEAAVIAETVRAIRSIPRVEDILVVDDGSDDETGALAAEAGARVLALPRNAGKGAALQAGLALIGPDVDVLLLLDADLGASASQAGELMEPVLTGDAAMSVATFPPPPGKAGFGLVKGLARFGIRRLGGPFDAHAPLSGQRVLSRAAIDAAGTFAAGYGVEVALTVRVLRAGLAVIEVPTTMTHDHTGRDVAGFAHRGRQFLDVARTLVRLSSERR